jgi:hypothetical protein
LNPAVSAYWETRALFGLQKRQGKCRCHHRNQPTTKSYPFPTLGKT